MLQDSQPNPLLLSLSFFRLSFLALVLILPFSYSLSFSLVLSLTPLSSSLCIVLLTDKGKRQGREIREGRGEEKGARSGGKINTKSKVTSDKEKRQREFATIEGRERGERGERGREGGREGGREREREREIKRGMKTRKNKMMRARASCFPRALRPFHSPFL